jgi:hypothetical protein
MSDGTSPPTPEQPSAHTEVTVQLKLVLSADAQKGPKDCEIEELLNRIRRAIQKAGWKLAE